jgi:proteasome lid subunit RPN8/RPN11
MMNPATYAAAMEHAAKCAPRESCGLIVVVRGREIYHPCFNLSGEREFILDPAGYAQAEEIGEITAVVHSHVNGVVLPSDADKRGCEISGLPWYIVGYPDGAVGQLAPCGWKAPLIGRQFHYGIMDCYTLAVDYYKERGITMPVVNRSEGWEARGEDFWGKGGLDKLEACGFKLVKDGPKEHDFLLFQVFYPVPHHFGVMVEDGFFLHHVKDRLSSKDRWVGMWKQGTRFTLRHEAFA